MFFRSLYKFPILFNDYFETFTKDVCLIGGCLMEVRLYSGIIFHHIFQKNSCFINNYCFATNEANPINWCQQCIPNISERTWTKRQGIRNEISVSFNVLSRRKENPLISCITFLCFSLVVSKACRKLIQCSQNIPQYFWNTAHYVRNTYKLLEINT